MDILKDIFNPPSNAIRNSKGNNSCNNNNDPPPFKGIGPIIRSPVDTKNYKAIQLPNGLKAVLVSTCLHESNRGATRSSAVLQQQVNEFNKTFLGIDISGGGDNNGSDPCTSDKQQPTSPPPFEGGEPKLITCCKGMSTVCVTIGSGAFHDPSQFNGMAHLMEHLVFLGSSKFPEENQIFTEVYKHGGIVNAVTQSDNTCFFFSAKSGPFEGCLERLADAIKFPLLQEDRILKEVEAVDSEYAIKQTCDLTRISDFIRTRVKLGHPMGNFYWGNKATLMKKGLCDALRQWHKNYYVAQRMTVCIHAPLPMKKLEEMVLRHFSDVTTNKVKDTENLLQKYGEPFDPSKFRAWYDLETVGHWDWLVINWSLPPQFWQEYESKPLDYIKRLMSTRTVGGLHQVLESRGFISDFSCGCATSDCFYRNEFTSMYSIHLRLTDAGARRKKEILSIIFSYIRFLQEQGKVKRYSEELKWTYATNFHHKNWEELLLSSQEIALSLNKQHIKPSHILTSNALLVNYSEEMLDQCLKLLTPKAACYIYASNRLEERADAKAWRCGIKYRGGAISDETYKMLENVSILEEFRLPPEKTFLCRNISFEDGGGAVKRLKNNVVHESDKVVVDYVSEKRNPCVSSLVRSASYTVTFVSPVVQQLPRKDGLLQIWSRIAFNKIQEEILFSFYRLYGFSVSETGDGLGVTVWGPSQNLLELLKGVVSAIFCGVSNEQKDKEMFNIAFGEQLQSYYNDALDTLLLSEDILFNLLVDRYINVFQLLDDLKRFNFEDYTRFLQNYKRKMFVEVELNGSVSQEDCEGILGMINDLNFRSCKLMATSMDRGSVVPKGTSLLVLEAAHPAYVTSLITSHYQLCPLAEEEKVQFAKILFVAMRRKLPQQLRTTEQLGYTARLDLWKELGSVAFTITVYTQPSKYSTEYVESRITVFLQTFYDIYLKSEKDFQQLVAPFVRGRVDFKLVKQFYAESLLEKGCNFRKLCVQVRGFQPGSKIKAIKNDEKASSTLTCRFPLLKGEKKELKEKGIRVIEDVGQFKRELCLLPV